MSVPSGLVNAGTSAAHAKWHAPLILPCAVLCVVTIAGLLVPPGIHLASLLIAVPALTAALTGRRFTLAITALACVAAAGVDVRDGLMYSAILPIHVIDVLVVCGLVMVFWYFRSLDSKALTEVRSVSEAAQRAVLRPLPRWSGQLRIASVYRSAAAQAQIGGDLYAAERVPGAVRLIIGDARGNGLPAVDDAAAVLGSFRESAHRDATLPELVASLERSVRRHLKQADPADRDSGEHFITALVVEIPDDAPVVRMISCGHPPPLRSRDGRSRLLRTPCPAPPLGLARASEVYHVETFGLRAGDTLLLHTDGLLEARDAAGAFYPASERFAALRWSGPEQLLHRLVDDLLEHVHGRLDDDVALVAMERLPGFAAHPEPE
jgi:hypothetical protein